MKKKKDPAFDELKSGVIKPMKEVVTAIKEYFIFLSTDAQCWIQATPEYSVDESIIGALCGSASSKVLEFLKQQRL